MPLKVGLNRSQNRNMGMDLDEALLETCLACCVSLVEWMLPEKVQSFTKLQRLILLSQSAAAVI